MQLYLAIFPHHLAMQSRHNILWNPYQAIVAPSDRDDGLVNQDYVLDRVTRVFVFVDEAVDDGDWAAIVGVGVYDFDYA